MRLGEQEYSFGKIDVVVGLVCVAHSQGTVMGCNPELISAFLDSELDSVILTEVMDHLLRCEECGLVLNKLATVKSAVSDRFFLPDPEDLTGSVMSAISNERMGSPSGGMISFLKKIGIS